MSADTHRPEGGLLPCPFCGGEAKHVSARAAEDAFASWVRCDGCGAQSEATDDAYSDPATAASLWNRRASPAPREPAGLTAEELTSFAEMIRDMNEADPEGPQEDVLACVIRYAAARAFADTRAGGDA